MKRIQSKLHRRGTYDDKRYILDDGISTLAYFHKYCVIISHWPPQNNDY